MSSWLGGSLSTLKGQLTNLISEGTEEVEDSENELYVAKSRIRELENKLQLTERELSGLTDKCEELKVKLQSEDLMREQLSDSYDRKLKEKREVIDGLNRQINTMSGEEICRDDVDVLKIRIEELERQLMQRNGNEDINQLLEQQRQEMEMIHQDYVLELQDEFQRQINQFKTLENKSSQQDYDEIKNTWTDYSSDWVQTDNEVISVQDNDVAAMTSASTNANQPQHFSTTPLSDNNSKPVCKCISDRCLHSLDEYLFKVMNKEDMIQILQSTAQSLEKTNAPKIESLHITTSDTTPSSVATTTTIQCNVGGLTSSPDQVSPHTPSTITSNTRGAMSQISDNVSEISLRSCRQLEDNVLVLSSQLDKYERYLNRLLPSVTSPSDTDDCTNKEDEGYTTTSTRSNNTASSSSAQRIAQLKLRLGQYKNCLIDVQQHQQQQQDQEYKSDDDGEDEDSEEELKVEMQECERMMREMYDLIQDKCTVDLDMSKAGWKHRTLEVLLSHMRHQNESVLRWSESNDEKMMQLESELLRLRCLLDDKQDQIDARSRHAADSDMPGSVSSSLLDTEMIGRQIDARSRHASQNVADADLLGPVSSPLLDTEMIGRQIAQELEDLCVTGNNTHPVSLDPLSTAPSKEEQDALQTQVVDLEQRLRLQSDRYITETSELRNQIDELDVQLTQTQEQLHHDKSRMGGIIRQLETKLLSLTSQSAFKTHQQLLDGSGELRDVTDVAEALLYQTKTEPVLSTAGVMSSDNEPSGTVRRQMEQQQLVLRNQSLQLERQMEEINKLQSDNAELRHRLRQLEEDAEDNKDVMFNLAHSDDEAEVSYHQDEIDELKLQLEDYQQIHNQLHQQITQTQNDCAVESAEMRSNLEELSRQVESYRDNEIKLHCQIDQLTSSLQNTEDANIISQLREDISQSNNQIIKYRDSEEQLNRRIDELVELLNTSSDQSTIVELRNRITEMEVQLSSHDDRESKLNEEVVELIKLGNNKEQEICQLRNHISEMEKKMSHQSEKISLTTNDSSKVVSDLETELLWYKSNREELVTAMKQKHEESLYYHGEMKKMAAHVDRLQQHLLEVEANHTKECANAEDREMVLREKLRRSDTLYESVTSKIDSTTSQLSAIILERDELLSQVTDLSNRLQEAERSLSNVQNALDSFNKEQSEEKKLAEQYSNAKILQYKSKLEGQTQAISELKDQLLEQQLAREAAERITQQIDKKDQEVEYYRSQLCAEGVTIDELRGEMRQLSSVTDTKIDKLLMRNLLIGYLHTPAAKKPEALRVLGGLLEFSSDDWKQTTGTTSSAVGPSFSQAFVAFLEQESAPKTGREYSQSTASSGLRLTDLPPSLPSAEPDSSARRKSSLTHLTNPRSLHYSAGNDLNISPLINSHFRPSATNQYSTSSNSSPSNISRPNNTSSSSNALLSLFNQTPNIN